MHQSVLSEIEEANEKERQRERYENFEKGRQEIQEVKREMLEANRKTNEMLQILLKEHQEKSTGKEPHQDNIERIPKAESTHRSVMFEGA